MSRRRKRSKRAQPRNILQRRRNAQNRLAIKSHKLSIDYGSIDEQKIRSGAGGTPATRADRSTADDEQRNADHVPKPIEENSPDRERGHSQNSQQRLVHHAKTKSQEGNQKTDSADGDQASLKGGSCSGKQSTNGKTSSGGGGNNVAPPPLQKRSSDHEFRVALENVIAFCKKNFITVGIFSVAVNLLILSIPIYLFQIADRVLTSRSLDTLVMLTVVVVGALGVHVLLDMARRYLLMRVALRVETALGGPILSAAIKSSNGSTNKDFQTVMDIQQVRSFLSGPVMLAFFDAPVAPIFFLAVYLIHPQLGLIVTTAAITLLVIALFNQKMTAVPFARAGGFSMRANIQADAMGRNSQVINAMGMIPEGVRLWGREVAESLKALVAAQDRNIIMTGLSKFIRLVTQITILGWGAFLAIHGELTGGMIIAASIIGGRALAPIEGTIEGWRGFVQARASYGRIKSLLHSSPLNWERLRLPRPKGRLSVERVLYVPPPNKKVILNGITFSLEPGESLAIVGPSGTGKSTLARMIVGALAPTAGSVRLDRMDIRNWDPRQFGETIGYLPQDVELFPATIKANIARMRDDVSDESIFSAADLAGVHAMISELPQGYETPISVDGSPLSGGQKQRIGLARAFFGDPKVVVLDEPNSNLDAPGEAALAAALNHARNIQITVITITQRPSLLKSVDKIMILNDGKVQALGARDEMIARLTASHEAVTQGVH